MKYCMQCGTAATDNETKCESCDFTHFHEPHPDPRDTTIARLRGLLETVDNVVLRNGAWKDSDLRDKVRAELEADK